MTETWRVILGPIVGALVGSLAGWLQLRYDVAISSADRDAIVASAMAAAAVVGALVKRFIDAHVNPMNAASPKLARIEKRAADHVSGGADAEVR